MAIKQLMRGLGAAVLFVVAGSVNAATVFGPVDGNVNFLFGDLQGGSLGLFDDSDQGYAGPFIDVQVPSVVGFVGPVNAANDHIATNSVGNTLLLSGSSDFILGLNVGGVWLADSSVTSVGANSYTVAFSNGGTVLEVDVQVVSTVVPVPAAAWLFGSGLLGLAGIARRRTR